MRSLTPEFALLNKAIENLLTVDSKAALQDAEFKLKEKGLDYEMFKDRSAADRADRALRIDEQNAAITKEKSGYEVSKLKAEEAERQQKEAYLDESMTIEDIIGNDPQAAAFMFGSKSHGGKLNIDGIYGILDIEPEISEELGQATGRLVNKKTGKPISRREAFAKSKEIQAFIEANTDPARMIETKMQELNIQRTNKQIKPEEYTAQMSKLQKATDPEKMKMYYEAKLKAIKSSASILPKEEYEGAVKDAETKIDKYTELISNEKKADKDRQQRASEAATADATRKEIASAKRVSVLDTEYKELLKQNRELMLKKADQPEGTPTTAIDGMIEETNARMKDVMKEMKKEAGIVEAAPTVKATDYKAIVNEAVGKYPKAGQDEMAAVFRDAYGLDKEGAIKALMEWKSRQGAKKGFVATKEGWSKALSKDYYQGKQASK